MVQYNASSSRFIALAVTLGLPAILAVLLRILARRRSKAHLGADDGFAAVALCGFLAFLGVVIWESYNGLHYDLQSLPPEILENLLKGLYISDILSPVPGAAGRFSLLFLYNRVFNTDSSFYVAVRILATVNGLWYVGCTVALGLQCIPPRKTWNPLITGHCINTIAFVIAAEIPEILLDFSMMILPISVLRRLQLSTRRKINMGIIFAVGGFLSVGVIGFLRIAITYRPAKVITYETEIWLCIQLGFSVICCCLPTYGPILPKASLFPPPRSLYSKLMSKIRISSTSRATSVRGSELRKESGLKPRYENLSDGGSDGVVLTQAAGEIEAAERYIAGRDFPMNAISVKSTVDMV